MFVDRVKINIKAGDGGDGCVSFRRLRYIPKGGPDGGDGGDGGSVTIQARNGVNNLAGLAQHKFWRATDGQHGRGSNRTGRGGKDLLIQVPPGTIVMDAEKGFVIKDLTQDGEAFVAARGGQGGKGNARFKTATNRAPREATQGKPGESRKLLLELQVIADVGLVGKPNAGKSTLLSRLSHARPEIADYPFTTKFPNLGLVQLDSERSFVMADIPGLIEGAHAGVGLGHEFLRHVERAGILVHLVEPCPQDESDPLQNYRAIREELTRYKPQFAERPELVAVTKAELPGAAELHARFKDELGSHVLLISAVTGQGLSGLTHAISQQLEEAS